jgi:DNA polymerase elongation subunit (family B)
MGDINDYLNKTLSTKDVDYIIAGDTDSVYINLEPLVQACNIKSDETIGVIKFLDTVCTKKLEPFIERRFMALSKMLGSYNHKLVMKRESICNKGIWRGKKMYILNVWNEEGIEYKTPKLKIKGIEAVRSTTPMVCRKAIREALSVIMNKEETDLHKHVADFETTFMKLPFEDIATPTSLNGLDQYFDSQTIYKLHCPIHVKGAILYNKLLIDKELTNKYQTIHNKDKIKYTYLKKPNPINEHVIGFYNELPSEFGLDKYVDYNLQFEKKFLTPIKSITSIIGWTTEKQSNLTRFFKK